jgi:glutamate--cysteine ligase
MIRGRTVRDVARDVLKIARQGLEQRDMKGCKGKTETTFLDVLDETVATGKTAADQLLDLYNGAWNGDISRVFRNFSY